MTRLHFFVIAFAICLFSFGQNKYLNTKTPYQPQQIHLTQPPKGYQPFFINYVGRHGARFLTSAGSDVQLTRLLEMAKKEQGRTPLGDSILVQLQQFESIENDNYGNITQLGKEEQQGIAARLQLDYPSLFQDVTLRIEATEKIRTQQSAKAFLSGFKGIDSNQVQTVIYPPDADALLRFYDLSSAYQQYKKSDEVKRHLDSLSNDHRTEEVSSRVCHQLFVNSFIQKMESGNVMLTAKAKRGTATPEQVCSDLYDVYCILFSAKKEMESPGVPFVNTISKAFTNADLAWLDQCASASDFYQKGPADNAAGIQINIAAPLLRNLVNTTDENIRSKAFNGIFRFTHAEAISPLATLTGIIEASLTSSSVFHFSAQWKAEKIIPLSANIQWIVYKKENDYLLTVLLNEKEARLPIATHQFPFYRWEDVKRYLESKLAQIKPTN